MVAEADAQRRDAEQQERERKLAQLRARQGEYTHTYTHKLHCSVVCRCMCRPVYSELYVCDCICVTMHSIVERERQATQKQEEAAAKKQQAEENARNAVAHHRCSTMKHYGLVPWVKVLRARQVLWD